MIFRILLILCCSGLAACVEAPAATTPMPISFNPNDPSGVGVARFSRSAEIPRASGSTDRNCADFASTFAAQQFFLRAGGPANDPHDLDRDGDGYACEWGTEVRRRAASAARARAVTSAPRCYTGPRGGTYTITASGNRNYDGC